MAESGTQAVVCESCGRLISAADSTCPFCGAIRIGGRASARLRDWVRDRRVPDVLFIATVVVYVASLVLSGTAIFKIEPGWHGILSALGPTPAVSYFLGAVNPYAVLHGGEPWRLLTYAFLHGGLLHIGFNMVWLRQIGPFLEDEYGPFRFATIYLGSAIAGGIAIVIAGTGGVGASGAIFGLTGAGFAYGKRRGGTWGAQLRGTFGQWALYGLLFSFAPDVSMSGHIGGLIGGFALGWVLAPGVRRSSTSFVEPPLLTLLGAALMALVPISFAATVAKGLIAPGPASQEFALSVRGPSLVAGWPLRVADLDGIGAPGWKIGVPRGWPTSEPRGSLLAHSSLGLRIQIRVEPSVDSVRGFAVAIATALNDDVAPDAAGIESSETAASVDVESERRAFRVEVRRLDGDRALVVTSADTSDVDRA